MPAGIPQVVQEAVNNYVEMYQVYKQLEGQMGSLREVIEPYMKESANEPIWNTKRTAKVQLTVQERAKMTSKYTTYDIDTLYDRLAPEVVKKCLVEVVDRDKVEALSKLGEIPVNVVEAKTTQPTYSFTVKLSGK